MSTVCGCLLYGCRCKGGRVKSAHCSARRKEKEEEEEEVRVCVVNSAMGGGDGRGG